MNIQTGIRLSRTELMVGIIVLLLLFALLAAVYARTLEKGTVTESVANCHQIILSLRLYAADAGGAYPDAKVPEARDSNTVFRQLIVSGYLEDEKIFGASDSPFIPDGDIGEKPEYARALQPNENHWAMTRGVDDSAPGGVPLVYENPAEPTWPPTWNVDAYGSPIKGKSRRRKIIVGTNDTSVEMMVLGSGQGTHVPLKKLSDEGLDIFTAATRDPEAPKYTVLDIAWTQDAVAEKLHRYQTSKVMVKVMKQVGLLLAGVLLFLIARSTLRKLMRSVRSARN